MFKYERLPDFCYIRLNHQEQECEEVIKMKMEGRKINREYESWLRAEGPGFQALKGRPYFTSSMGESSSNFLPQCQRVKSASRDVRMGGGSIQLRRINAIQGNRKSHVEKGKKF